MPERACGMVRDRLFREGEGTARSASLRRSRTYSRAGTLDRGRGTGMQLSKLSCGGLYGESEKFLFGTCMRDTDIDIGDLRDEAHENLLTP